MNGIEGIKGMIQFIRGAFLDWQEEIIDMIIGDEMVVTRFSAKVHTKVIF